MDIELWCFRHSLYSTENWMITPEGIKLAQKVAREHLVGIEFADYWSTPIVRGLETMLVFQGELGAAENGGEIKTHAAFGSRGLEMFSKVPDLSQRAKETGLGKMAYLMKFLPEGVEPIFRSCGVALLNAIDGIAQRYKDGDRVLIVSHGGTVEPAALIVMGQRHLDFQAIEKLEVCEAIIFSWHSEAKPEERFTISGDIRHSP